MKPILRPRFGIDPDSDHTLFADALFIRRSGTDGLLNSKKFRKSIKVRIMQVLHMPYSAVNRFRHWTYSFVSWLRVFSVNLLIMR